MKQSNKFLAVLTVLAVLISMFGVTSAAKAQTLDAPKQSVFPHLQFLDDVNDKALQKHMAATAKAALEQHVAALLK
jgi:hypothetical protein